MTHDLPDFDAALARTLQHSRYARRCVAADPALAHYLRATWLAPVARSEIDGALASIAEDDVPDSALRVLRRQVVLRTMLRDLSGLADLDEVVTVTSDLAEAAIGSAVRHHTRAAVAQHGTPRSDSDGSPQQLVVVGMGKLGGRELNVSSDIDLVFVYGEDGATDADGKRAQSNRDWFTRVGQRVIATLSEATHEGFVFRVDMRLRPFGDSGPLLVNFDGLEHYFITSARPWERYAWLKARPIQTGSDAGADAALLDLVRPFVYRKYHDYGALQDLRELHGQIRAEAQRKNRMDDIKIGPGGIREIEFIAQLFQLIRGGRETRLQTCSTREALRLEGEGGQLAPQSVEKLLAAYSFLRNLEHRLQYLDDAQTQALPRGDADRALVAASMGFEDTAGFMAALERHRSYVSTEFDTLFAPIDGADAAEGNVANAWQPGWLAAGEIGAVAEPPEELLAWLRTLGYADPQPVAERLCGWRASSRYRFLTEKGRAKFDRLIPVALQSSVQHDPTRGTFFRVFDLLEAVDRRDAYLSLLVENPRVLERVARLAAKSAWAADLIKRHPILLDELLQTRDGAQLPDWPAERQRLESELDAAHGDVERQYDLLRHFKQVHTLRLNIADVDGTLPVMALADELSALADLLLDATIRQAWRSLKKDASDNAAAPVGFAVIGYGKLGSKELGYASDLDLVYVYDETRPTPMETWLRLGQRLNQWLNTMTSGGVLYETDLRLRPDGASGLMVASMAALRDYQLKRAWTWEHQALTRARFCAGDPDLAPRFDAVRAEVLALPRERVQLCKDIVAMRAKMRAEHPDRPDRLGRVDLKLTQGGIIDLEFIVQFLVLAHSSEHPGLIRNAGNFALLNLAGDLGYVARADAAAAAHAYLAFRARQHLARNNNDEKTWVGPEELRDERAAVTRVWTAVFGS